MHQGQALLAAVVVVGVIIVAGLGLWLFRSRGPRSLVPSISPLAVKVAVAAEAKSVEREAPDWEELSVVGYDSKPEFLTLAERSFFNALRQSIGNEYYLFSKVRLADIVRPSANCSRRGWTSAFNRISAKHVDYVLCEVAQMRIVAVIELDNSVLSGAERAIRDVLVDSALSAAKIPILRVVAKETYLAADLRQQLDRVLFPKA